jgi:hypothetical protein
MRNKTINQICNDAAKYAIETLDIEKALTIKLIRDTERAETQMCTGFDVDIEYTARLKALEITAEQVRQWKDFIPSIESAVYDVLSKQKVYNKTRLEVELEYDRRNHARP